MNKAPSSRPPRAALTRSQVLMVGDDRLGSALRPFQPRGELHFITSLTELPVAPPVPVPPPPVD